MGCIEGGLEWFVDRVGWVGIGMGWDGMEIDLGWVGTGWVGTGMVWNGLG